MQIFVFCLFLVLSCSKTASGAANSLDSGNSALHSNLVSSYDSVSGGGSDGGAAGESTIVADAVGLVSVFDEQDRSNSGSGSSSVSASGGSSGGDAADGSPVAHDAGALVSVFDEHVSLNSKSVSSNVSAAGGTSGGGGAAGLASAGVPGSGGALSGESAFGSTVSYHMAEGVIFYPSDPFAGQIMPLPNYPGCGSSSNTPIPGTQNLFINKQQFMPDGQPFLGGCDSQPAGLTFGLMLRVRT